MTLSVGKFRAEKVEYPDGIGCSIWQPFGEDTENGLCWDFSYDDLVDVIAILSDLWHVPAEKYVEEPEPLLPSTRKQRFGNWLRSPIHDLGWWLLSL